MRSEPPLLCLIALILSGGQSLAAQATADSAISAISGDSAELPAADSNAAVADSAAPPEPSPQPALVVNVPPPVDPVVERACRSVSAGSSAPNLIGVVFRAEATDSDRTAAAREVGGTLVAAAREREAYISLPDDRVPVRTAASKLIKVSAVSGVSEVTCPG